MKPPNRTARRHNPRRSHVEEWIRNRYAKHNRRATTQQTFDLVGLCRLRLRRAMVGGYGAVGRPARHRRDDVIWAIGLQRLALLIKRFRSRREGRIVAWGAPCREEVEILWRQLVSFNPRTLMRGRGCVSQTSRTLSLVSHAPYSTSMIDGEYDAHASARAASRRRRGKPPRSLPWLSTLIRISSRRS